MTVEAHDYSGTAVEYVVSSISDSFTDVFQISVVTVTEMVLLAMLDVEVIEAEYVRQDDPVIFVCLPYDLEAPYPFNPERNESSFHVHILACPDDACDTADGLRGEQEKSCGYSRIASQHGYDRGSLCLHDVASEDTWIGTGAERGAPLLRIHPS